MKLNHELNLSYPSCKKPMKPIVVGCAKCNLEMRGHFKENPFALLDADSQHFLHVFIYCEGKISDMEKALGIRH